MSISSLTGSHISPQNNIGTQAPAWKVAASLSQSNNPYFTTSGLWQSFVSTSGATYVSPDTLRPRGGSSTASVDSGQASKEMRSGTTESSQTQNNEQCDEDNIGRKFQGATPDERDAPLDEDLRVQVEQLEDKLQQSSTQAEEYRIRMLRSLADMENLRERTSKQLSENKKFAVQGLVVQILDVADNLERAAAAVPSELVSENIEDSKVTKELAVKNLRGLLEGVRATQTILHQVLEKNGVQKYESLNEEFDPNRHNALFQVPDSTKPAGIVTIVSKPGYTIYDRVLRAAEVGVTVASG